MPSPSSFLSRRWLLALLGVAALVFRLAMLHPYPRQSLFGPTIHGNASARLDFVARGFP